MKKYNKLVFVISVLNLSILGIDYFELQKIESINSQSYILHERFEPFIDLISKSYSELSDDNSFIEVMYFKDAIKFNHSRNSNLFFLHKNLLYIDILIVCIILYINVRYLRKTSLKDSSGDETNIYRKG